MADRRPMNKKEYLINGQPVQRPEFFRSLRQDCTKTVATSVVAGWCGIDICKPDEKKYRQMLRRLERGAILCFPEKRRTYSRRTVRQEPLR